MSKQRKRTIEQAAEERAIELLDNHQQPLKEHDAKVICTQLETRANMRINKKTSVASTVVGIARVATGGLLGVGCLNYEKTGAITSKVSSSVINGLTKIL